jgi:transcriptional regulator with XRE-family HTH domain
MSNVDRTFLSGIENGKRNISISALQKISRSLEIDINDLFNPAN